MIIDIHAHIAHHRLGDLYVAYAEPEDLVREMKQNGVDYAVVLPTYFPHSLSNGVSNEDVISSIAGHKELVAFGSLSFNSNFIEWFKVFSALRR